MQDACGAPAWSRGLCRHTAPRDLQPQDQPRRHALAPSHRWGRAAGHAEVSGVKGASASQQPRHGSRRCQWTCSESKTEQ